MLHIMHLKEEPFKKIMSEKKIYEIRLYDQKRQNIAINDEILFVFNNQKIKVKVINLYIFKNFSELFDELDYNDLGYDSIDEARPEKMYQYYSKKDENLYGVIAIKISLIKN